MEAAFAIGASVSGSSAVRYKSLSNSALGKRGSLEAIFATATGRCRHEIRAGSLESHMAEAASPSKAARIGLTGRSESPPALTASICIPSAIALPPA